MDTEQSKETQTLDDTECLSKPESSLYSPNTDRQRARSLPVDLYQDASSSHDEHPSVVCGKRVQFADTMGLNLANVRHFDISDDANQQTQHGDHLISVRFVPAFEMPVSLLEFDMKSRHLGVALESVTITASEVKGVIRVIQSNARDVGVSVLSD
ncbi:hypothetical protein QQF64_014871 [Cirrhinus molitorella]|uniref:Uncharacterized protein n=2 Tax=Cirrhinus molitorella TaxID=172907 RepID=A0ABR3NTD7_9TELE|nr:hypothetical protein Q8A67_009155 [Cirrhinus molitorella]